MTDPTRRPHAPGVRGSARPRSTSSRTAPSTGGVRIPKARAASRPGGASRTARSAPARNRIEPVQIRGSWLTAVSVRAFVLVGVVVLAAAVVLPSLRAYFRQQEELADLRADAVAAQESVDDLSAELKRWDDPAYVEAQARERLAYVYPGETAYRVIDPETVEDSVEGSQAAETGSTLEDDGTWYTRLWGSVEEAGDAPVDADADAEAGAPASSANDAD
ncbi:FtsB family cell division protein [Demequina gelatinilytica]|uniref:FtsB family cell division protein n=1 Tax=Demequina gelatinilytica TaxID=1638980 RepID=UPI000AEA3C73|nr:septum formation initiator family protein [Demequina gelatinilytica]